MEAMSFDSLQDAGDNYSAGSTQVWYWREDVGHQMMRGYKYLESEGSLPDPNNLSATHALVGTLAETSPEQIWNMMQAENWSPQGEARAMISKLGVGHTSMSVGDIVVINKQVLIADSIGFVDLASGEKTDNDQ